MESRTKQDFFKMLALMPESDQLGFLKRHQRDYQNLIKQYGAIELLSKTLNHITDIDNAIAICLYHKQYINKREILETVIRKLEERFPYADEEKIKEFASAIDKYWTEKDVGGESSKPTKSSSTLFSSRSASPASGEKIEEYEPERCAP
jgi:hypothetical protein